MMGKGDKYRSDLERKTGGREQDKPTQETGEKTMKSKKKGR